MRGHDSASIFLRSVLILATVSASILAAPSLTHARLLDHGATPSGLDTDGGPSIAVLDADVESAGLTPGTSDMSVTFRSVSSTAAAAAAPFHCSSPPAPSIRTHCCCSRE